MAKVPKSIKDTVWKRYNKNKSEGKCYCCRQTITFFDFEVGHNIAKAKQGSNEIDNLRPICRSCNSSMGTRSIEEFKATYFTSKPTPKSPPKPKKPKSSLDDVYSKAAKIDKKLGLQ